MPLAFPPLYVIIGAASSRLFPAEMAGRLAAAGVELIQYRDKQASSRVLHQNCLEIAHGLAPYSARLIVNDRPDVAILADAGGVHVGQDDLPVAAARAIVGQDRWVGVSTHTLDQVRGAERTSADYIAFGPIFLTTTKVPADPTVGLAGLRRARALTRKPLVAIGGITLERVAEVWRAGADAVAVSQDIVGVADPPARAQVYLRLASAVLGNPC